MGYYTKFCLSAKDNEGFLVGNPHAEGILISMNGYAWPNGQSDPFKWYDHEEDMKEFSRHFPNEVFELNGEGEDSGDIWTKYFKNGKMQKCRASIVIDGYDESKLL